MAMARSHRLCWLPAGWAMARVLLLVLLLLSGDWRCGAPREPLPSTADGTVDGTVDGAVDGAVDGTVGTQIVDTRSWLM